VLQVRNGAYQGDFGANPDEPSHYINGLLIRDYIGGMSFEHPMRYAENYYLHYPKVALGHWPPVFYVFEALWMQVFSVSRNSVMMMIALQVAILAAASISLVSKRLPFAIIIVCGFWIVSLPLMQTLSGAVSPEPLVALMVLLSAACYARYLETERWEYSMVFGVLASVAVLTKGSGFVLALVPAFAVVFLGRFRLLRTASFWLPVPTVLALAGPWYAFVPNARHEAALSLEDLLSSGNMNVYLRTPMVFLQGVGVVSGLLALVGLVFLLFNCWQHKPPAAFWVVSAALLPSFLIFRTVVAPARSAKNWSVIIVPCILLAGYALSRLASVRSKDGQPTKRAATVCSIAFLALSLGNLKVLSPIPRRPIVDVAELATQDRRFRDSVILVASDASGEGAFVAQVAMREPRPGHFVLRASKVLGLSGWFGSGYRTRHENADELMDYMRSTPVGLLVVDDASRLPTSLADLLDSTLQQYSTDWELIGEYPERSPREGKVRVYRHVGFESPDRPNIQVDMANHFGKVFSNSGPDSE